jgi:class I fructose-bisphosphate aldolase/fructose-bisphosphate aldolase/2-amino-3,7-dideoxy-D-threo-hept-6-ulosonate synthase
VKAMADMVASGGADAAVVHKGAPSSDIGLRSDLGLIIHLSASTSPGPRSEQQGPRCNG